MSDITLVHLNGPNRGQTDRFEDEVVAFIRDREGQLRTDADGEGASGSPLAVIRRSGPKHEIWPAPGAPVLLDGVRLERPAPISSNDVIEVGEERRAFKVRFGAGRYKTIGDALADCAHCARHGDRSLLGTVAHFGTRAPIEVLTRVPPWQRAAMALALGVVLVGVVVLSRQTLLLQAEIGRYEKKVDDLALELDSVQSSTITADDVRVERERIQRLVDDATERFRDLTEAEDDRIIAIARAAPAVTFLQGSYGFRDPRSGELLRLRTLADGSKRPSRDRADPPLEFIFSGTGFLIDDDGLIATNRHIAEPWNFGRDAASLREAGFLGTMLRLEAYVPGQARGFPVRSAAAHDTLDVAFLRCEAGSHGVASLEFAQRLPAAGEEVTVLGYPSGLRAVLARTPPELIRPLLGMGRVSAWELAEALAAADALRPLATAGVVGQVSATAVVYDAATTYGGSGGPVLAADGRVIAINSAIVPEFGGSNLGVPAPVALEFLLEFSRAPEEATAIRR